MDRVFSSDIRRRSGGSTAKKAAFKSTLCLCALLVLVGTVVPAVVLAGPAGDAGIYAAPALPSIGERFGVVSVYLGAFDAVTMDREVAAIEGAGITWVRCDFAWLGVEPLQGVWNFAGSDALVDKAGAQGIEILGILGSSPPWANGGQEWNWPPSDIDAWRNYVRTVVSRYAGRVSAWEIWNEENIHAFWQPEPDSAEYMVLLEAASQEIRAADPSATIVMGGVAGLGYTYLKECLDAGAAGLVDAIAYHPYAETIGVEGQPEEDLLRPKEALCRYLVGLMRNFLAGYGEGLEIWLTEVGWTTCDETPPGVDEDTQAAYLLRTMINYATTDVDRVMWYNLREIGLNDWDFYGLLENDFTPRPSYAYYSTFFDIFGPAMVTDPDVISFTCFDPSALEAHCFVLPDGDLALAAWKSDDSADSLTLTVSDPSFRNPLLVDPLSGATQAVPGLTRDASGGMTVTGLAIGKTPVILTLEKVAVTSISPSQAYQHTFSMPISDLAGSGFQTGAAVRLEMDGKIISAYAVNVVSEARITCTMGFFGVEPGVYDVVVTNPDGSRARLEDAFKVISLCGAGGGTALLAIGLMLGLLSAAGSLGLHGSRRRKRS